MSIFLVMYFYLSKFNYESFCSFFFFSGSIKGGVLKMWHSSDIWKRL
jgi:hypothetical protein